MLKQELVAVLPGSIFLISLQQKPCRLVGCCKTPCMSKQHPQHITGAALQPEQNQTCLHSRLQALVWKQMQHRPPPLASIKGSLLRQGRLSPMTLSLACLFIKTILMMCLMKTINPPWAQCTTESQSVLPCDLQRPESCPAQGRAPCLLPSLYIPRLGPLVLHRALSPSER